MVPAEEVVQAYVSHACGAMTPLAVAARRGVSTGASASNRAMPSAFGMNSRTLLISLSEMSTQPERRTTFKSGKLALR